MYASYVSERGTTETKVLRIRRDLLSFLAYVANAQILFNLPSLCVFVVSKRCIVQRVQKPKYLYQEEEAYRFKVP